MVSHAGPIPARSHIKSSFELEAVFSEGEIRKAFSLLRRKRKYRVVPGVRRDRYNLEHQPNALGKFLAKHDSNPRSALENYELGPYQGILTYKKNGKPRPLLVPTPRDRWVFIAALSRIKKVIESRLAKYNALGVGVDYDDTPTIRAICVKILQHIREDGFKCVLALDFQDYFSSINRQKLNQQLRPLFKKAGEGPLYDFVWASINNQIDADELFDKTFAHLNLRTQGIPQGLAYSPLLASFFGTKIDHVVARHRKIPFYRYLDDMIVFGKTRRELLPIYRELRTAAKLLDLKLHPLGGKTKLVSLNNKTKSFEFLGIVIAPYHPHGLLIPEAAIGTFKEKLRMEVFTKGADVSQGKKVFSDFVDGWARHYSTVCPEHYAELAPSLNAYIIECMSLKRKWESLIKENKDFFQMP